MGGQGMSKYEEITLVLVIGLCLAVVVAAFKTDLKYHYPGRFLVRWRQMVSLR